MGAYPYVDRTTANELYYRNRRMVVSDERMGVLVPSDKLKELQMERDTFKAELEARKETELQLSQNFKDTTIIKRKLFDENQKLKKALEFYADENEWIDYKAYGLMADGKLARVDSHFDGDLGKKARVALGWEK